MNFIEDFSHVDRLVDGGVKNAVIDVDNTITKSNIAQFYLFIKRRELRSKIKWTAFIAYCVLAFPFYIAIDIFSRDLFNKLFVLRKFKGYSKRELERYSEQFFEEVLKKRFIPYTHDLIFRLKMKNVNVVLLSTNFDLLIKQYGKYFDVPYVCLKVYERGSGITIDFSDLDGFKGREIRKFNASETIAIGDSKYDLPALEYVKYPMVVAKKKKGWMDQLKNNPVFIRSV